MPNILPGIFGVCKCAVGVCCASTPNIHIPYTIPICIDWCHFGVFLLHFLLINTWQLFFAYLNRNGENDTYQTFKRFFVLFFGLQANFDWFLSFHFVDKHGFFFAGNRRFVYWIFYHQTRHKLKINQLCVHFHFVGFWFELRGWLVIDEINTYFLSNAVLN